MLCKEAAMIPLRELIHKIERLDYESEEVSKKGKKREQITEITAKKVTKDNLETALIKVKNTQVINLNKYVKWQDEFGSI
jgi:SpoVK/Ycf46/Vps4 family AAA+-type ATPase